MKLRPTIYSLLPILLSLNAAADEPAPLDHNPFDRPRSTALPGAPVAVSGADSDDRLLELRATMVGGTLGLANVGGTILKPGDEIGRARLLRVFEDRAEFLLDGKRMTVFVRTRTEETDD